MKPEPVAKELVTVIEPKTIMQRILKSQPEQLSRMNEELPGEGSVSRSSQLAGTGGDNARGIRGSRPFDLVTQFTMVTPGNRHG